MCSRINNSGKHTKWVKKEKSWVPSLKKNYPAQWEEFTTIDNDIKDAWQCAHSSDEEPRALTELEGIYTQISNLKNHKLLRVQSMKQSWAQTI